MSWCDLVCKSIKSVKYLSLKSGQDSIYMKIVACLHSLVLEFSSSYILTYLFTDMYAFLSRHIKH
jgi:hypothetical protein